MQLLPREVLLPCQIFGWFPLHRAGASLVFSYAWFAWGLVVTLSYSVLTAVALHRDMSGRLEGRTIRMVSDTSAFTVLVARVAICTTSIVVFISTTVQHRQYTIIHEDLSRLDRALKINTTDDTLKYKIIIFLTIIAIAVILTISYYTNLCHTYVIYIPYWISFFVQASVVIFFINICSFIKERFLVMNNRIREEIIKQSFGQLLLGVEECTMNFTVPEGEVSLTKIRWLTEQYWRLCELMRKVDCLFSWHLFVSVVSLSLHTIIALFNLFSAIWPVMQHEIAPQLVLRTVWVTIYTLELLLILRSSTSMTDKAHGTAPMICKLLNRCMDTALKRHLEIFLLALRHQNAKFSALGLFQVQNHILTPIAGAVTTYLVILIQFQAQTTKESYNGLSL